MTHPTNLRAISDRIEQLLDELRVAADPRVRDQAEEVVRLVTELYGAGLAHIVDVVGDARPGRHEELVADELVGSLLLVHGLHPDDLEHRVRGALESVRPFLGQHGGDVELLDIDERAAAVYLRLLGSCDGCPSSSVTLRMAVERAIVEAAPEITTIDVDQPADVEVAPAAPGGSGVPITLKKKPPDVVYDPAEACGQALCRAPAGT